MERLILQNQLVMMRALLAVVTTSEAADALRGAIDNTEMALSVWKPDLMHIDGEGKVTVIRG